MGADSLPTVYGPRYATGRHCVKERDASTVVTLQLSQPPLSVGTMTDWDTSQQAVFDIVEQRRPDPLLVYGAPGTGKSALAVELGLRNLQDGYDSARLLLLSPSRLSAARLRDALEHQIAAAGAEGHTLSVTEQPSKSFASYAFWLLGEARRLRIPGADEAPRLLSGAEQDRIIGEIVKRRQAHAEDPASPWHELQAAFEAETGLRRQLRDFLDRCREYSIGPDQLRQYAAADVGRPVWAALADVAEDYDHALEHDYPGAYDAATLMTRACRLLEQPIPAAREGVEPLYFWEHERQRLNRIIVDDIQDAGPSVYRLLRLIGVDHHLIAFASPDTAVQGFRGARPDKLAKWAARIRSAESSEAVGSMASADSRSQSAPTVVHLSTSHRISGEVAGLYRSVSERIGVVSSVLRRVSLLFAQHHDDAAQQVGFEPGPQGAAVSTYAVALPHLSEQLVLQQVLEAHHKNGVPWNRIAVLVRSGAEMKSLARVLDAHGVAVARSISDTVLHDEPAIKPLLRLLEAASLPQDPSLPHDTMGLNYQDVLALLSSAYGGVDAVQLRRLHQELLTLDRGLADQAPELAQPDDFAELSRAELLLLHAITTEGLAEQLQAVESAQDEKFGWVFRPLDRIRQMAQAARTAIRRESLAAEPEQALWRVWAAAGVAERWQHQAGGKDLAARQANRNLDAVITLFQTAERFVGQHSGATVADFIDYIGSLDLPMDSIAETGQQYESVEVLTPSTAAGREFDTVIISGLQEGAWPNLQPRGELLGSSDLVALHEVGPEAVTTDLRGKRAQTLQDEYRLFAAAVSRARRQVTLIAVDADESAPSSLFEVASPAETTDGHGVKHPRPVLTRVPRPIEGRALAAELRGVLEGGVLERGSAEANRAQPSRLAAGDHRVAASLLARLHQAGVHGAHPDSWWGYRPMTTAEEPIIDAEQTLRLSPSKVDAAVSNPLGWFTDAAGGTAPSSPQQSLGTFIHDIAERHPDADLDTLNAVLDQEWDAFRTGASWANARDKARAQKIIRFLGLYYAEAKGTGRVLIGTELFLHHRLEVPGPEGSTRTIEISGKADRVEWAPPDPETDTDGGFYVVDFKTGKGVPKDDEVTQWYPQIDIYQWAAVQGAVTSLMRLLLTSDEADLQPRELETKQNLLTVFAISGIDVDPEAESLTIPVGDHRVRVGLDPDLQQPVAGAALVQLGTTNQKLKIQEAGAEAAQRAPEQITQAARVMSGSEFWAHHEPTSTSCYAGLLCPLCSTGKQVSEP